MGKYLSHDIYWQDGAGAWRIGVAGGEGEDEEQHSSQKEELHILFFLFFLFFSFLSFFFVIGEYAE